MPITEQELNRTQPPSGVEYLAFDHVHFWVGNAVQAAAYYITRFGFQPVAYRGLETGSRQVTTQVVRQNGVVFAFSSALEPNNGAITTFLARHGDGVHDVAFAVTDCNASYNAAIQGGAKSIQPPTRLSDATGVVMIATIASGGVEDLIHTFVQRGSYSGAFLPGYIISNEEMAPGFMRLPPPGLLSIDHVVSNLPEGEMAGAVAWYEKVLNWHRFWSVDDDTMHTEYSALRSVVVADFHERVKMPLNEPAAGKGRRRSQIQEFVDYYGGPGVQHLALRTANIVQAVDALRARGVTFINVPDTYYDDLRHRLNDAPITVGENLNALQRLGILVDFDDTGYLLQIFTKPLQSRPTLFIEIIQRRGHEGFGAGNFKSLFQAIEREQALRGNL